MTRKSAAKIPQYTGPINVMTVREVAAYLARASSHDLQAAEAPSDSGVSDRQ